MAEEPIRTSRIVNGVKPSVGQLSMRDRDAGVLLLNCTGERSASAECRLLCGIPRR